MGACCCFGGESGMGARIAGRVERRELSCSFRLCNRRLLSLSNLRVPSGGQRGGYAAASLSSPRAGGFAPWSPKRGNALGKSVFFRLMSASRRQGLSLRSSPSLWSGRISSGASGATSFAAAPFGVSLRALPKCRHALAGKAIKEPWRNCHF